MWPFLARVGWFLRRSTPGWVITGITTADLLWACAAAFFALVAALTLTFGLALAGFLSVILAMGLSLTPGVGRREGRGRPLGLSYHTGKRSKWDIILICLGLDGGAPTRGVAARGAEAAARSIARPSAFRAGRRAAAGWHVAGGGRGVFLVGRRASRARV